MKSFSIKKGVKKFLPQPLFDPINLSLLSSSSSIRKKNFYGDNILPEANNWLYDELDPPIKQSSSKIRIQKLIKRYSLSNKLN